MRRRTGLTALFWRYLLVTGGAVVLLAVLWWGGLSALLRSGFVLPAGTAAGQADGLVRALERGGAVGHGVVELEQAHRAVGELGGAVVLLVGEAVEGAVAPQRGPGIAQVPLVHAALPHHLGGAVEGGPAVVVG